MKQSCIFALPALLRPALLLAAASQHSFSVNDDLFAYPQYEVRFSEQWISETEAESKLDHTEHPQNDNVPPSEIEHYRPSDQQPSTDSQQKDETTFSYEHLKLDGQPYLCSIPQIVAPAANNSENDTLSKLEQQKELARANDRGWELLSGMQGQCVYFISGWWSYKFCYNDGVRQFHQLPPSRGVPVYPPVEDSTVEGYTLGAYKKEDAVKGGKESDSKEMEVGKRSGDAKPTGEIVQRGESRFLVQKLEGGTTCDLTEKPRRIDVQVSNTRIPTHPSTPILTHSPSSTATPQPPTASPSSKKPAPAPTSW